AKHSSLGVTMVSSSSFFLLLRVSFKYLIYFGICKRASTKGMLICSCLRISRNCPYCSLTLLCISAWGYGILGLYSFIGSSTNSLLFFFSPSFPDGFSIVIAYVPNSGTSSSFCLDGVSFTLKSLVSFFIGLIGVSPTLPINIALTCSFGFGSVLLGRVP